MLFAFPIFQNNGASNICFCPSLPGCPYHIFVFLCPMHHISYFVALAGVGLWQGLTLVHFSPQPDSFLLLNPHNVSHIQCLH